MFDTRKLLVWSSIGLTALLYGCPDNKFVPPDSNPDGGNNGAMLGNIGDPCTADNECSAGLVCGDDGTCQAAGNFEFGAPCTRTGDCAEGLFCDQRTSVCAEGGTTELAGPCAGTEDCVAGLICAPQGLSGACVEPGDKDLGDECSGFTDCIAGLGCAGNPLDPEAPWSCQPGLAGFALPFQGVECAEDEMGNFRAFFEVDSDTPEFYRLPYPNDIRLNAAGHPDLSGHPTPGAELLGFDIVQRYIDAIGTEQDKFGLNSWLFFRFSETANFDSIVASGDDATLYVMNITPTHADYGRKLSMKWASNTGRGSYICQNWVAVRAGRDWGHPLDPDTTYAVFMTTGVRSEGGVPASPDEDFAAMLGDSKPAGALGEAWDKYQILRDFIADQGIDSSTLAMASVFTTGNPIGEASALRSPARSEVPALSDLTLCDGAATSPCDDGLEGDDHVRGCMAAGSGYHELHGKLSLPIFQDGDAPYLEEGGKVSATVKRREDVCIGMSVPDDAAMPAEGWPVIVYGHGTGGNFRGHIGTLGDTVHEITIDGETVKFLTIGWDQVQHFTRRGDSDKSPNDLVFNYVNPPAAKGNFLQAAADVHAVAAFVEQLDIAADQSPTGQPIKADPNNIYFIGHSQGGTSGPLALPFDTTFKGTVLSGAGAGLILALLGKTTPVNSPQAVQVALMERNEVKQTHPVLNILQAYFDPVDPVNFGQYLSAEVIDGLTVPKHVFHTNGLGDTYTPPEGMNAMARALRATYILPYIEDIDGVPTAAAPFGGNIMHDMATYSALGRQYEPDGDYDGHFVMTRHPTTQGDVQEFLWSAVQLGVPEIR